MMMHVMVLLKKQKMYGSNNGKSFGMINVDKGAAKQTKANEGVI